MSGTGPRRAWARLALALAMAGAALVLPVAGSGHPGPARTGGELSSVTAQAGHLGSGAAHASRSVMKRLSAGAQDVTPADTWPVALLVALLVPIVGRHRHGAVVAPAVAARAPPHQVSDRVHSS